MKNITPLLLLNVRQFMLRHLYSIAIALALVGCAASLIRVDLSKIGAPPPGKASIFVIRPSYLSYAARDLSISANNKKMADLIKSSYTSFVMPPGKLTLAGEGGFISWPRREITIDVAEGQTYYLTWIAKETASSALMMMLFPILNKENLRWEVLSKEDAQNQLNSVVYVEPVVQEIPK